MRIHEEENTLSIDLNEKELVALAQFFAPGEIVGLADPFNEFSEEEKVEELRQCRQALMDAGYLEQDENDNWKMDEYLAAFIYSCIHAKNVMFLRNELSSETNYFHFLPNWILSRVDKGEEQRLTLYRTVDALMNFVKQIIPFPGGDLALNAEEVKMDEKKWEEIRRNYFSGETSASLESMRNIFKEYSDPVQLSSMLFETDRDFWIRVGLDFDEPENKKERDYRIFGKGDNLFFAVYEKDEGSDVSTINISQVDAPMLSAKLQDLIPVI
ncbi:MAG: hypothetical protein ACTSQ8_18070 [Candidatus Helarchaeota archaeon]